MSIDRSECRWRSSSEEGAVRRSMPMGGECEDQPEVVGGRGLAEIITPRRQVSRYLRRFSLHDTPTGRSMVLLE